MHGTWLHTVFITVEIWVSHEIAISTGDTPWNPGFLSPCPVFQKTWCNHAHPFQQEVLNTNLLDPCKNKQNETRTTKPLPRIFFFFFWKDSEVMQWNSVIHFYDSHCNLWDIPTKTDLELLQLMLSIWTKTGSTNGQTIFLIMKSRNSFGRPWAMSLVLAWCRNAISMKWNSSALKCLAKKGACLCISGAKAINIMLL